MLFFLTTITNAYGPELQIAMCSSSIKSGKLNEILYEEFNYAVNAERLRRHFKSYREYLYDDLRRDNMKFLSDVLSYCGVPTNPEYPEKPQKRSIAFKSFLAHRALMKAARILTGIDTAHFKLAYANSEMAPSVLKSLMDLNDKNPHFLTHRQIVELKKVAAPIVEGLRRVVGDKLELKQWGYF